MASFLTRRRLLGFKDFFPNEIAKRKEFYGAKLGKEIIEKGTCFFLSFLRHKGTPEIEDLLKDWFTFYNFKYFQSPSYWQMASEYRRICNYHGNEKHTIISVEALLNMFLWVRNNSEVPDIGTPHDASSTLPFFELILLFNDDVLLNYHRAAASIVKYGNDRKLQRLILAGSFSQSDLTNIDYAQLLYTQIYKKAKLLKFLDESPKYQALLTRLLAEFNCSSKEEYLKAVSAAAVLPLKSAGPSWNILSLANAPNKKQAITVLTQLAVSEEDAVSIEQDDYLALRNRPFQKLSEDEYRIIFELFLIKKIYNGLLFKLSSYHKDFLGNIRDDFSEGILVYEILQSILLCSDAVLITGNQFKAAGLEREPDFYCRVKDSILLFESKDFFMRGAYKLSYDFDVIERELMKSGRLKKAVQQLAKNIERCFLEKIPFDNSYNAKSIEILPVIIVHDSLYSAPGLNYWVYYWLKEEMNILQQHIGNSEFDFAKVMPVTLVEIDTLILYEKNFIDSQISLPVLIKEYHEHVEYGRDKFINYEDAERHALKSAISFSEFVREKCQSQGIDLSFDIISEMLFEYGIV